MMSSASEISASGSEDAIPFDAARLDDLLESAGIDILIASSKHNVQYLLGGYRFFFFDHFDAIGVSRYLPLFLYVRGRPDLSAYIGNAMEKWEAELGRFWVPHVGTESWGTADATSGAINHIRKVNERASIGVERDFLPASSEASLRAALPDAQIVEASFPLERLRARKSAAELSLIREASDRVVGAMASVFSEIQPGMTKLEAVEALRREQVARGLVFEYCLVAAGSSRNRAPSDQILRQGDVVSLDSGANYRGYIGDLCRMAVLGEPDAELEDLLGDVDAVQQAARSAIRPGAVGADVLDSGEERLRRSRWAAEIDFIAHGIGLVSHEAPRLTSKAPMGYAGYDRERPLQSGMVLSIETAIAHPRRGLIKLEDTIAVTNTGFEAYGDHGRGWNRAGQ